VNTKSIDRAEKSVKTAFEKVIRNQKMLKELGEVVVTDIKFQSRRGKFEKTGKASSGLTDAWIERRKNYAKNSDSHPAYSPKRKNVTLTGELLDSLKFISSGAGKLKFFFDGIHKAYRYRKLDGSISSHGGNARNKDIQEGLDKMGYKFFRLRPELTDRLKKVVVGYIRRASRALNKI
jgi:hypothetical protein